MTKQEAIQKMQEGYAVTHNLFSDNEFIGMKDDMIVTEEGYPVSPEVFWADRKLPIWEEGWELLDDFVNLTQPLEHERN